MKSVKLPYQLFGTYHSTKNCLKYYICISDMIGVGGTFDIYVTITGISSCIDVSGIPSYAKCNGGVLHHGKNNMRELPKVLMHTSVLVFQT